MNSKEFKDRLALAKGGMSSRQLALASNISPTAMNKYLSGESEPTRPVLQKISEATGVCLTWLVSGEGPMRPDAPPEGGADDAMITHFDIEASAGGGSVVDSELVKGKIAFKRKWLEEMELDARFLNVISVRGDSMEPTLTNGQLILINRQDIRPRAGIYVLNLGGDVLVKRVQRLFNGDLKITSDNTHYEPETIPADQLDQVRVIGRVVWKGGLPL